MPKFGFVEPELTVAEWAYMAGIIDGEGCLGVYTRSKQQKKRLLLRKLNGVCTRRRCGSIGVVPR